ncbi:hypothetical protein [Streptomyces sp. NPDC094468]|uniref:hypothetical protein n=1 Tax=Streptomyces sp. NPDC094468 TaxID=3366066 RepID=UPI00382737AF
METVIDEDASTVVTLYAEHYLISVAEYLMTQGAAISAVFCHGPESDPENPIPDVSGTLNLGSRFARQLDGKGCLDLHWTGNSGWFLGNVEERNFPTGSHWMGNGLLPEANRVASFLEAYRLDPAQAGSTERPYYRAEKDGLPELVERLAAFVPPYGTGYRSPGFRFSAARDDVYYRRVLAALRPEINDYLIDISLHAGELEVILQALEYAQVAPTGPGMSDFVERLASDLEARRGGGRDAALRHRSALAEAAARWRRMEKGRLIRNDAGA